MTQEKIYDSSYIIWVPYIQQRLKPWLRRFHSKRRQSQLEKDHLQEELDLMQASRDQREGPASRATDLIMETGG